MEVLRLGTVVSEQAQPLSEHLVIGHDHPAVADGAQVLRGEEGEAPHDAHGPRGAAILISGTDGLRCVFDHGHLHVCGELENPRHVGALAEEVHGDDGFHPLLHRPIEGGPRLLEARWAHVVASRVDVGEDRHGIEPGDDASRGKEGVGGRDDPIARADPQRHQSGEECIGARRHPDTMARADVVG